MRARRDDTMDATHSLDLLSPLRRFFTHILRSITRPFGTLSALLWTSTRLTSFSPRTDADYLGNIHAAEKVYVRGAHDLGLAQHTGPHLAVWFGSGPSSSVNARLDS